MALSVLLTSVGNPDFGQNPNKPIHGAVARRAAVEDIEEASKACLVFIAQHDLGMGNWNGGLITDNNGKEVGQVSYNGCVWAPGGCRLNAEPIYNPASSQKAARKDAESTSRRRAVLDLPGYGKIEVTGGWEINIIDGTKRIAGLVGSVPGEFSVGGQKHEFLEDVFFQDFGVASLLRSRLAIHPGGLLGKNTPVDDSLWNALNSAVADYFASPEGIALTVYNAKADKAKIVENYRAALDSHLEQIAKIEAAIAQEEGAITDLESRLADLSTEPSPGR